MMGREMGRVGRSFCLLLVLVGQIKPICTAQIADDKCKFLGNIIAGYTPTDFGTFWNQVSPENAGKWGSVEGTRDVMQWGPLDNAYNTARDNGFPFKQHTFVWGQQQPSWIGTLSVSEQKEEVEEWIKLFCERYPDTDFIDVVNEPLHSTPVYDLALGTGWNWVIWAFQKARQYCPKAKLILNDYNIVNSNTATDSYIALVNMLKEKGLIDIIGEQGHFLETTPVSTITSNLTKLHATGLPIHVSEFDVNIEDDSEQLNRYQELFPALWGHAGVQGITLWGYKQGEIWRQNAFLVRSNGTERPALPWLRSYVANAPGGTFCIPVTGIEQPGTLSLSMFPNPTTLGVLNLISWGENALATIMTGQAKPVTKVHLPAGTPVAVKLDAPPGIYVIKITTPDGTTSRKFVIQ